MGIASYSVEYRNGSGAGVGTRSLGRTGSYRYWSRVTLTTDSAGCSRFRVSMKTSCYNGATKLSASEYAAGAQVVVSTSASNSAYTGSVANLAASHPANDTVWYFTGDVSCRLNANTTYYLFVLPCWSEPDTFTQGTETFTVESLAGLGASVIASCSANAATLGAIQLTMTRYDASYQHVATFSSGGVTLATSGRFDTNLGQSVPRAWFDSFPNAASITVTVSVQTYSGSTAIGSPATATVTVTADAGMAPSLKSGFAAAAAYNANTAAASISGYVQGYSRARVTLKKSKVTLMNNASVASYSVSCQGAAQTVSSPGATATVDTGVLTGASETAITVTVTDSRGRTASTSLTVTPMAYAPPTISAVAVFRCLANGTASENGACYSAKGTAGCSSLGGQNSVASFSARVAQGGGSYGGATALTSGTAKVVSAGLDPDQRATVKLTVTDALGGSSETAVTLPGRKWAMKFRADGQGVGFGKAPENAKSLEVPADWTLRFGTATWLSRVWPVGSIYMSMNGTDPGTLFGGTWEQITGRFLLATGSCAANSANSWGTIKYPNDWSAPVGETGGEDFHALTVDEMPQHYHTLPLFANTNGSTAAGFAEWAGNRGGGQYNADWSGGNVFHNNMPPYLAVYMWKRTA